MKRLGLAALVLVLAACDGTVTPAGDDGGALDAGLLDAGLLDAGPRDAGPTDAGSVDAGARDAGPVDAGSLDAGPCPDDASYVVFDGGVVCVDRYEAALVQRFPDGGEGAWPYFDQVDGSDAGLRAVTAHGTKPQGYVSAVQGQALCHASGKRLCALDEWLAACRGPDDFVYPYGDTFLDGGCNVNRPSNPIIDVFGSFTGRTYADFNDPRLDQLPDTISPGGSFTQCVSAWGVYDLHGNVHEWVDATTASGHGVFKGGFFVDASLNGPGCLYATTAHDPSYHDYSTGFRCCADPAW